MEYNLVQVKKENLAAYSRLLSNTFKETTKYSEKFLLWQYFQNPNGNVIGFDAFCGEELAAHYVTIPVTYSFDKKLIKGVLSLNTATGADHQGKGLFTKLAARTYELAASEGYQFVIGVANQNSTHGFIKKLGFELISPLDVKIYTGTLAHKSDQADLFRSAWNQESATWRLKNPEAEYFYHNSSVFSKTHFPFLKSLLTSNPFFKDQELKKLFFNPMKIAIGLNLNVPTLSVQLPDRFKPSPLNLIFKNLSGNSLKINRINCYFELIDFDAY